jgi:hypothetical protein
MKWIAKNRVLLEALWIGLMIYVVMSQHWAWAFFFMIMGWCLGIFYGWAERRYLE